MALQGYVTLNSTSTEPGAPIDAFLLRTLRQNGDLLDKIVAQLGHNTWIHNDGSDGPGTLKSSDGGFTSAKLIRSVRFTVDVAINATVGIPLVIMATESITINANINAVGTSAPVGTHLGNLGGGGGGGATATPATPKTTELGAPAVLPFSNAVLAGGGAIGANGTDATGTDPVLRCLPLLPTIMGGGPGGNGTGAPDIGGRGGGVVVLVAPEIIYTSGVINVAGAGGAGANSGGGGGGCVVFITYKKTGFTDADFTAPSAKFNIDGGGNQGTGKPGGKGRKFLYTVL